MGKVRIIREAGMGFMKLVAGVLVVGVCFFIGAVIQRYKNWPFK